MIKRHGGGGVAPCAQLRDGVAPCDARACYDDEDGTRWHPAAPAHGRPSAGSRRSTDWRKAAEGGGDGTVWDLGRVHSYVRLPQANATLDSRCFDPCLSVPPRRFLYLCVRSPSPKPPRPPATAHHHHHHHHHIDDVVWLVFPCPLPLPHRTKTDFPLLAPPPHHTTLTGFMSVAQWRDQE
eukprot:COSAG02_NODE_37_length_48203_cov_57.745708_34_plen_181_part_00